MDFSAPPEIGFCGRFIFPTSLKEPFYGSFFCLLTEEHNDPNSRTG
jgi:hypothetical protein